MLKYCWVEISKELPEIFEEEEKKDENLISKFMDNFKKIKEKFIENSQGIDTYAKHLLELVDRSIPFGNYFFIYRKMDRWYNESRKHGVAGKTKRNIDFLWKNSDENHYDRFENIDGSICKKDGGIYDWIN